MSGYVEIKRFMPGGAGSLGMFFSVVEELAREEFGEVPIKCADIYLDLRADRPCFCRFRCCGRSDSP